MKGRALLRHVQESLDGFYRDGGAEFWRIFHQTPRAAVAAFKAKPEMFGALDDLYAHWPKSRKQEHARISGHLDALLAEAETADVPMGESNAEWPA